MAFETISSDAPAIERLKNEEEKAFEALFVVQEEIKSTLEKYLAEDRRDALEELLAIESVMIEKAKEAMKAVTEERVQIGQRITERSAPKSE
jgi:hypothetical protein